MVVQKTIDNLKDRPHDEKKTIASGIAIGVVLILLVGWGFLFLRKIQRGSVPTLEGSAVPQDQIDAAFIQQTQQQINQLYQNSSDQYKELRENSAQNDVGTSNQTPEGVGAGEDNAFGSDQ